MTVSVKMKAKSEKGDDTAVGAMQSDMSNTPRRMSYFHLQRYVYLLARIANGDAKQPYHPSLRFSIAQPIYAGVAVMSAITFSTQV